MYGAYDLLHKSGDCQKPIGELGKVALLKDVDGNILLHVHGSTSYQEDLTNTEDDPRICDHDLQSATSSREASGFGSGSTPRPRIMARSTRTTAVRFSYLYSHIRIF